MATASPQRAYRAACPNCGAPVDFTSAASAFAVCSFCRSTVVREGDALRRIGTSAELFDDHSPLQLGVAGRYQGVPFTLVGRIQYRSSEGTWNEWHALFDSPDGEQRPAWLGEDNGRHVLSLQAPLAEPAPDAASLQPGAALTLAGVRWTVASVTAARLLAVQGELPSPPPAGTSERDFTVVDLRNERGEVATLDYADPAAPTWSIGRSVALSELALTGLAEVTEKALAARGVECPSCGAALQVKLGSTQSIVCHQCRAVVDVSQGVGGDLQHYAQAAHAAPQIPLGTTGVLALGSPQPLSWQVVGYVERCEVPQSPDDEQTCWREYLLYHRTAGFAFLVDAEDGWSWTAPITGVPERAGDGVKLDGVVYRKLYDYVGRVTYVLGEFYWRLTRDQQTANTDYAGTGSASAKRLNRERTSDGGAQEIVWSAGEALSADAVLKAFRLAADQSAALQRDVKPSSGGASSMTVRIVLLLLVIAIVWSVLRAGSSSDCSDTLASFGEASQEYQNCLASQRSGSPRTGGGSYGGFSSGGGHK